MYLPEYSVQSEQYQSKGPHMSDEQELADDLPGFLVRHPILQYVLLAGLGILGIYLSVPLDFAPLSAIEWVDLMINIAILVPSCVLLGAGAVLAVLSGISPRTLGEESRPARFTRMVLRTVGIPRAIVPKEGEEQCEASPSEPTPNGALPRKSV